MAALTTRELVINTAPELAAIPYPPAPGQPDQWGQALADVGLVILPDAWGDLAELAQRLWVAHILTLGNPELEKRQVTSVAVGSVSKSLIATQGVNQADRDYWMLTRHGRRLLELQRGLLRGMAIMVL